jgi:aspartyl-tRNA(Asn)/glutamyl-tRNA(Gln) amidotransferase subunit A
MSEAQVPDHIVDRLRTNLRGAGIPFTDADLTGMVEKGFVQRVVLFEQMAPRYPADGLPDYLAAWGKPDDLAELLPSGGSFAEEPVAGTAISAELLDQVAGEPSAAGPVPSLAAIARRIAARDVSPVELTEQALAAIAAEDPALNAFQLVLAERARAAAREAEREIARGDYRGPLHGVPVAVKDLFALAGNPTTAGSKILAEWVPDFDAAVVEALERSGAVIVGKTRMSEYAYSPGSNNGHYGPTHNPWNREHDTGGSSSGSAAAVAAGLVFAAIGTDTGGSIRIPSSLCGIVGIKPTFGRVSLHGAITLSWSLDHAGPMARTVTDAALLLDVLEGQDRRDPRTRHVMMPVVMNLDAGVRGLRVGVVRDDGSGRALGTSETVAAWRKGLAALAAGGAELIEIDLPELEDLRVLNSTILALEAASFHESALKTRLDDYGEFMRHRILAGYGYAPDAFVRAQQIRAIVRRRCRALFDRVDLVSTPTMPYGAPLLGTPASTAFTAPFNVLGWPAITVPVGLTEEGLPLGLQLAGQPWDEATVFRAARVVEAAVAWPGLAGAAR